jgi:hypothetical protein
MPAHSKPTMPEKRREFYRSSNGDAWFLCLEASEQVYVEHEPNAPSGGKGSRVDIGIFLAAGPQGAEHQSLIRLIGTLVENAPPLQPSSRIA